MVFTREEFVEYLKNTLVPDLRNSGHDYTAADFDAARIFIEENAREVEITGYNEARKVK